MCCFNRKKKDQVAAAAKAGDATTKKDAGASAKKPMDKKLPAVPESVLKRRKKRDARKVAKLKVALKVS